MTTNEIAVNIDGQRVRVDYTPAPSFEGEEWWLERSPDGTTWTHLNYPERNPAGTPSAVDDPPVDKWLQYRVRTGETGICRAYTSWLRTVRYDTGDLLLERRRPIDFGMGEPVGHVLLEGPARKKYLEETSHVLRWLDDEPEHPVIAELRAQPGRWAVIRVTAGEVGEAAGWACKRHPNVETKGLMGERYLARWVL